MNDRTDRMPMVRIANMRRMEKKDGTGSYFVGYMGQTKVMLFRDNKSPEGKEFWNLLVQEQSAEERERFKQWKDGQGGNARSDTRASQAPAQSQPRRSPSDELNDEVPF